MNRRENWKERGCGFSVVEVVEKEKQRANEEEEEGEREREKKSQDKASERKEKDSRVVLLLDEIEFLFDPLASVSHREFQPSRSPAASSATLQHREKKERKKKEEEGKRK